MHKLNTLTEQILEKFLFDVASVSKYLSIENLCKYRPHSTIPVIYVCPCKTECSHFAESHNGTNDILNNNECGIRKVEHI